MKTHAETMKHGLRPIGRSCRLLLALTVVTAVPGIAWCQPAAGPGIVSERVRRGEFVHEVVERGNIESIAHVEIRCEVTAQDGSGTAILEIVPEGTSVKPGDFLVKLDSSALEQEKIKQQIVCENYMATLIQARHVYETALLAKQVYVEGTYPLELRSAQHEVFVAEEELRLAEGNLKAADRLVAKAAATARELEAARFAVRKVRSELELAKAKLEVLEKFTKQKMLTQLDGDVKTARARLGAEEARLQLSREKLAKIEGQIDKCTIKAPASGLVLYANQQRGSRVGAIVIQEGTVVRERQPIIRLLDPKQVQVRTKIHESQIAAVKKGMPATIRVDAFPDLQLKGTVATVAEYPEPASWFTPDLKEYAVTIRLQEPPADLRVGFTAEVKILVARLVDVLQVPVQAVLEHGRNHYCVILDGQEWQARQVTIGPANSRFVVIREGLQEGQQVAINAARRAAEAGLPRLEPAPGQPRPDSGRTSPRSTGSARVAQAGFSTFDKNQNGRLEHSELPAPMRASLRRLDTNGDGGLDRDELSAAFRPATSTPKGGP